MPASDYLQLIKNELAEAWLPRIYQERILKLRTRAYHFENARPSSKIGIQHTLLGVELKVGKRRLLCPDLATARYLLVFARLGCKHVAVPYDITKISRVADELESSWYRMFLLVDFLAKEETEKTRTKLKNKLSKEIRAEITAAGAGAASPEFKRSTRQLHT